jgi:DNA helicase HerA-like ATPase
VNIYKKNVKELELQVIGAVDLGNFVRGESVWENIPYDIPDINSNVRELFDRKIAEFAGQGQPTSCGVPILGQGGSGKTHVLSHLRQKVFEKGGYFIMADFSTVTDFWKVLADESIRSLEHPGFDGQIQRVSLLQRLARLSGAGGLEDSVSFFDQAEPRDYAQLVDKIYRGLFKKIDYRTNAQEYQDLIRALLLWSSPDPDIFNDGKYWYTTDRELDEAAGKYGFKNTRCPGGEWFMIGLTWLFSITASFSVIAIDQLDSTVQLYSLKVEADEENQAAQKILYLVCNGFSSLITFSHSCLTVVTFLADSWASLHEKGLKTSLARFSHPQYLTPVNSSLTAKMLLGRRLEEAFKKLDFKPSLPTWPFLESAFENLMSITPRELLQKADHHIHKCLKNGKVTLCQSLLDVRPSGDGEPVLSIPEEFLPLENRFRHHYQITDPKSLKNKESENTFWVEALAVVSEAFAASIGSLDPDEQIVIGDDSRPLHKTYRSFAFLRYFHVNGGAADRCLSLWAILHDQAKAFQARLKTALDQSGIDKDITIRRLIVIRFTPAPFGQVTAIKIKDFERDKGIWLTVPDKELKIVNALYQVSKEFSDLFLKWVVVRKPVLAIKSIVPHLEWLLNKEPPGSLKLESLNGHPWPWDDHPTQGRIEDPPPPKEPDYPPIAVEPPKAVGKAQPDLLIGRFPTRDNILRPVTMKATDLLQHTTIIGGTGSGKTVLLRRLIEEAALGGTSAVIIDISGDLCYMGLPWPDPKPDNYSPQDVEKAQRYFSNTETIIWTPKVSKGNPLRLPIIPNLTALRDDPDALNEGVGMAVEALQAIPNLTMMKDLKKRGLITFLLRYMAGYEHKATLTVSDLIELLLDLPPEVVEETGEYVTKIAPSMANDLKSAAIINPDLKEEATTSIADLFRAPSGVPRISVINLQGINSVTDRQSFVQKLMMNIFSWITHNKVSGLAGLIVIDEANDFLPSVKQTPCKSAIQRLANQARKFGYGLILASQGIKSLDSNTVSNCGNIILGRQSGPTSIETCKKMGFVGVDKLPTGHFLGKLLAFQDMKVNPASFNSFLCLSWHPKPPPTPDEITKMAYDQRVRYGL